MKKRWIALGVIAVFMIMVFTACGNKVSKTPEKATEKIKVERTKMSSPIFEEKRVKDNVFLEGENVGGLKESDIANKIASYSGKKQIAVREAKLDDESWKVVQKERAGKKVNVEKTVQRLLAADPGEKKKLVVETVKPKTKGRKMNRRVVLIGKFTTTIADRRDSRINNIQLAAERLDYEKIQPGEEFSFNGALGRRTVKKGYERAPIIIRTENGPKKSYGVGGGICQLSSTMYNAAYKSGMSITERHSHSKSVGYVPKGRDAMVAYGSSDLKFVNNRKYPVMIRVRATKSRITVRIYENRNGTAG